MLIPSLIAPFAGLLIAAVLMLALTWLIRRRAPGTVNRVFRRLQLVSGGFVAFTHGTNDAQKTMGIIALALVAGGHLAPDAELPPTWVIVGAALAMGAGTYAGGWRIIKTLGTRIAKLDPPQGFAAQTACASILWTTAHYGFPVSTTHTISGSVMGAGASRRRSRRCSGASPARSWLAWVMTIPCAALVGAAMEVVTRLPAGDAIVFLLAAAIAAVAFLGRRWQTRRLTPPPRPPSQRQAARAGARTGSGRPVDRPPSDHHDRAVHAVGGLVRELDADPLEAGGLGLRPRTRLSSTPAMRPTRVTRSARSAGEPVLGDDVADPDPPARLEHAGDLRPGPRPCPSRG